MPLIHSPAPAFDCSALIHRQPVALTWPELHGRRWLILLFEPPAWTGDQAAASMALGRAGAQFEEWDARLALVWEAGLEAIAQAFARAAPAGGLDELPLPILADPEHHIARLYEMRSRAQGPLFGYYIIDPQGIIRGMEVTTLPLVTDLGAILRFIEASAWPNEATG